MNAPSLSLAELVPKSIRLVVAAAENQTFTNAELRALTRPCVYLFMKAGVPLYIGSSANGLVRVANRTHHKLDVRLAANEVRVLWFRTARQARCAERELIKSLNPAFNGKSKPANAEPRQALKIYDGYRAAKDCTEMLLRAV
jgi:excinuclease UvrABC nuclease subunit